MASETVADGLDHPECVIVDRDGSLIAGSESGVIHRIDPATGATKVIAETGGFILGLALDDAGSLYICDNGRSQVLRLTEGELSVYSSGSPHRPMRVPNYATFDDAGNLYVSDSGSWGGSDGCIFRIAPGGETVLFSESTPAFPNGLALSPDGAHLYVVESLPPAIKRIELATVVADIVIDLPGAVPDGLAFDVDGGLYISCYRPDAIYRLDTNGELSVFSEDPLGTRLAAPTNIAFDGTTLYVANFARWHLSRLAVPVPGLPLRRPAM